MGFDYEILEESTDRSFIEGREEYWIDKLDTFNNGLNESPSGKGYGHNSPNFTTLGYVFTDEQRGNMSAAARERARKEGFNVRSGRSKKNWEDADYAKRQSDVRKGKRLRPPKLSDEEVDQIKHMYNEQIDDLIEENQIWNKQAKLKGWKQRTLEGAFFDKNKHLFNVSKPTIVNIVKGLCRTQKLPSIYKS